MLVSQPDLAGVLHLNLSELYVSLDADFERNDRELLLILLVGFHKAARLRIGFRISVVAVIHIFLVSASLPHCRTMPVLVDRVI